MMILFYGGMQLNISKLSNEIPHILIQVNAYVHSGIFVVTAFTIPI